MENKNDLLSGDNLLNQIVNISKANAYDIVSKQVKELQDKNKELEGENEKVKRLLHDLTPGGSEFYNDPEYCANWIREDRQQNHYTLAGIIKEKKGENERLKIYIGRLLYILECERTSNGVTLDLRYQTEYTEAKAAITKAND